MSNSESVQEKTKVKNIFDSAPSVLSSVSPYRSYKNPSWVGGYMKNIRMLIFAGILLFVFFPVRSQFTLNGRVTSRDSRTIIAKTSGEIVAVNKSNGDTIEENEIIGRVYNATARQSHQRQKAILQVVMGERDLIKQKIQSESKTLQTYLNLFNGGYLSKREFDGQQSIVDDLNSQLEIKDRQIVEQQVQINAYQNQIDHEIIRSNFKGIITSLVEQRLKGYIREGETFCDVSSGGMQFEFDIPEQALQSIHVGQQLKIKMESFPGQTFHGELMSIRPMVFEDRPQPWLRTHHGIIIVKNMDLWPASVKLGMTSISEIESNSRTIRFILWIKAFKDKLA